MSDQIIYSNFKVKHLKKTCFLVLVVAFQGQKERCKEFGIHYKG